MANLAAGLPNAPMSDTAGNVALVWRAFFAVLQARTGGGVGVSSGATVAALVAETANRIAADAQLGVAIANEAAARFAADAAEAQARGDVDDWLSARISNMGATQQVAFGFAFFMAGG